MTARELCAPLEMCRRIPPGEFGDSHFVHVERASGKTETLSRREAASAEDYYLAYGWKRVTILCPAVTLEEVIKAMDGEDCYQFFAGLSSPDDVTAATALEAWLAAKGVK